MAEKASVFARFLAIRGVFRPRSGAAAFFGSIIVWGVGTGCFAAALNNFLAEVYRMGSFDRGILEFFRELPGLLLVLLLALLHRMSSWRIMRLGALISMAGAAALLVPADKFFVTACIMIYSTGEHLVMPVRSVIAMQVAREGRAGQSLGFLTGVMNFGTVAGSAIVALIFWIGSRSAVGTVFLFGVVWVTVAVLMAASVACSFSRYAPDTPANRPPLLFRRKFVKFYGLELFYGARKQIFLTFAPYVLIRVYGFPTARMALLLGICAAVNIWAAPLVGRLTDRWGYRNVMIWDTVVLAFVCLLYGGAGRIFSPGIAAAVVCVNFLLDAVISTTSLAASIYVREISSGNDETTSTLSTGISINHLIAIFSAPLGGWVWQRFGVEVLFAFAAAMAVGNTLFALTLPKPAAGGATSSRGGAGSGRPPAK